jgi:hypothetical protein
VFVSGALPPSHSCTANSLPAEHHQTEDTGSLPPYFTGGGKLTCHPQQHRGHPLGRSLPSCTHTSSLHPWGSVSNHLAIIPTTPTTCSRVVLCGAETENGVGWASLLTLWQFPSISVARWHCKRDTYDVTVVSCSTSCDVCSIFSHVCMDR